MKANKCSSDWIEFVDDHIECKICGARMERGIINVSGHWVECKGKETMEKINKIAYFPLYPNDKLALIKQLFNIEN